MTLLLALAMVLALIPCGAVAEGDSAMKIGVLSYLNLTEEEFLVRETALLTALKYLEAHGMLELSEPKPEGDEAPSLQIRYYDTTDALLMALQAGEIDAIRAPKSTADYLCGTNDRLVQPTVFNFLDSDDFVQDLLNQLSDGYAFMMLEANADLRDQFDQAIADMKADGTLDALVLKHIAEASRTGEIEAIAFEQFEGGTHPGRGHRRSAPHGLRGARRQLRGLQHRDPGGGRQAAAEEHRAVPGRQRRPGAGARRGHGGRRVLDPRRS